MVALPTAKPPDSDSEVTPPAAVSVPPPLHPHLDADSSFISDSPPDDADAATAHSTATPARPTLTPRTPMAPMSPTYDRLEAGRSPTSSINGSKKNAQKRFRWKRFAIGAGVLLALVWLFVPREAARLPGWTGSGDFEKGNTPYEGKPRPGACLCLFVLLPLHAALHSPRICANYARSSSIRCASFFVPSELYSPSSPAFTPVPARTVENKPNTHVDGESGVWLFLSFAFFGFGFSFGGCARLEHGVERGHRCQDDRDVCWRRDVRLSDDDACCAAFWGQGCLLTPSCAALPSFERRESSGRNVVGRVEGVVVG
ncbi:hypothetical protein B0H10DRAFT_2220912 [Mycena sp. CBHHK59/15]|nr:hypothetical protein B0H10DRAFT_2220912 [Mycena sp. CBHHK59/15]